MTLTTPTHQPRESARQPQLANPSRRTFIVPQRRSGRVKLVLQTVVIGMLAIAFGFAISSPAVGEIAIAVYGVIALFLRFSSRTSFALALIAFGMIIPMEIIQPASNLATNFAVYAFLLLVVGTIALSLELRQEAKWNKERRRRREVKM